MVLAVPHFNTSKEIQTLAELQSYVYQFTSLTVSSQIDAGVCECIKVCRWWYSGGMCGSGVCV